MTDESSAQPWAEIDTSIAHTARVWNYWLGGKDHYEADREVGEQIRGLVPDIIASARADRAFLGRAVTLMVTEGIRQFLDVGTGLPTADNTHEVAQALVPECRIVYVDNDPIVLVHAQALLTSTPEGACNYIEADARDIGTILRGAAATLDFGKPVGVMLLGTLNFIEDDAEAQSIVDRLLEAVPSGSHLAIAHPTAEVNTEAALQALQMWNESATPKLTFRSSAQIARFFDGLELLEPGVVSCSHWRPSLSGLDAPPPAVYQFCGVGRKP